VQFIRHVTVRAVLSGKQVAVWSIGKVEGVARALCENVSGVAEGIGVVWEQKIRGGGRQTKNLCCQRDFARVGKDPADVLDLAMVRSGTAVEENPVAVGTDDDAVEHVVESGAAEVLGVCVGKYGPDACAIAVWD